MLQPRFPLISSRSSRHSGKTWVSILITLTLLILFVRLDFSYAPGQRVVAQPSKQIPIYVPPFKRKDDVGLVVSKAGDEDINWVLDFCERFKCTPYIYSLADVPEDGYLAPYTNMGHEASAYLSYLVDHYDSLHPYTIFIHGKEEHWHNDVAGPKTMNQIPNLRFEAIDAKGFVNLRCLSIPGCPNSLYPSIIQQTDIDYQYLTDNFPEIYSELFGVDPDTAPSQLGHKCCGQFAVTRERIQERPWKDYNRILQWVVKAEWSDSYGIGWLMEKLWHVIFGMPPIEYAHSLFQSEAC
ncbi:hypothetical protein N7474_006119 [Penicillium riverlandense]|uniref:uncharacterized protein n=1 Tax=Penicillium riverlandense TaxID=1903569 RepID=UPI0025488425|nr:uncharacterized protein N7474_006119 [Penicillium riverlandense]KAJ5820528.1 hypothetical protein N7474_006119 [Penicillium riverlandense]